MTIIQHQLYNIRLLIEAEVPLGAVYIDEAKISVALLGGITMTSTAIVNCQKNLYVVLLLKVGKKMH